MGETEENFHCERYAEAVTVNAWVEVLNCKLAKDYKLP